MKKYLFYLGLFLIIISFILGIYLPQDFNNRKETLFYIEEGWGLREIALNLEKQDLIWWAPIFKAYVILGGMRGELQAGYYYLSPSMNIYQIAEKFTLGDIAKVRITIPEGFTSEQIYHQLSGTAPVTLDRLKDYQGYLFPDTYEITYGMKEKEVIKMMTDNFNRKTAHLEITPESIIMASLLEKEVKTKEEKELAAGILWKG